MVKPSGRPPDYCDGKPPCGCCFACRCAKYNESVTGLAPLDSPGTEAYYKAVMAESRRHAERLARPGPAPAAAAAPSRKLQLRVYRTSSETVTPQKCDVCGTPLNSTAFACHDLPFTLCFACGSKNTHHKHVAAKGASCLHVPVQVAEA